MFETKTAPSLFDCSLVVFRDLLERAEVGQRVSQGVRLSDPGLGEPQGVLAFVLSSLLRT